MNHVMQPRSKMRILLIGNIAQNGYLLTKFLRRAGYEADLLIYSYSHLMGQPEWEDADIRGNPPHFGAAWGHYVVGDYHRPPWVHEVCTPLSNRLRPILSKLRIKPIVNYWSGNYVPSHRRAELTVRFRDRFGAERGPLRPGDIHYALEYTNYPGIPPKMFHNYDIFIGAGLDCTLPMLLAPGKPYLCLEHGTMRDLPFEDSAWGRLLALAYDQADGCIITNPDCVFSASQVGPEELPFHAPPGQLQAHRPRPNPLPPPRAEPRRRTAGVCPRPARLGHQGKSHYPSRFCQVSGVRRSEPGQAAVLGMGAGNCPIASPHPRTGHHRPRRLATGPFREDVRQRHPRARTRSSISSCWACSAARFAGAGRRHARDHLLR